MTGGAPVRRLTARRIWIDHEHSLPDAEIVWDAAGRIVALHRARGPVRDLAVFPGLVNAHVHLQLEPLTGAAPREFLPWVRAVMAQRGQRTPAQLRLAAERNLRALQLDGNSAFGEIDSTGQSCEPMQARRAAGRCYQELTGFHLDLPAARRLVRSRWRATRAPLAPGLSPHAPYSVSADLVRAAARRCGNLSIHCAELPEEQEFLHTGKGPFAALLESLGRLPAAHRPRGVGAVRWLERLAVLRRGTQLVHCQELERGDLPRIVAAGASMVVCPGTITWFGRQPPPVARWLAAGATVAIGTDSRAGNADWSIRTELRRLGELCGDLSDEQLLRIATRNGAISLGRPGIGRLRRGGRADLVAVRAGSDDAKVLLRGFVRGTLPTVTTLVCGRSGR